ncbi:glucosidase 2 subunit beta isoform X2 [Alligator mississippiensis]|uniref:glucosidase 2 subunit beta isoform X2 n=1 Tax=Alligator mississippiensis TaxID=8496 RepID=UPI0006EC583B|nr:glucosidase 2 subunit beta isoform X2 [Alligator mississippiensis]
MAAPAGPHHSQDGGRAKPFPLCYPPPQPRAFLIPVRTGSHYAVRFRFLERGPGLGSARLPPPHPSRDGKYPCALTVMLLLVLLCPLLGALACAVEVMRPRGVSLTNHHFYDEMKPFTCLDGSTTIAFEWVNDDYCDCPDGSDEPGTSACPNGRFHCTNAGFRPQYIPSSRVNDGICDCCDATDEYNSGSVCENTCKELGRREREALQQMAEVAREGFRLKQVLIEEATKGREEKQKQLGELQEGRRGQEERVGALRLAKEAAEKPEKEAKDMHHKHWEEQQALVQAAQEQAQAHEAFEELDSDSNGLVTVAELQAHAELDVDGDGTLSEAEAQTLLGDTVQTDLPGFRDTVWAAIKEHYKSEGPAEVAPEPPTAEPLEPVPEDEEEEEEDEDDDEGGSEDEPTVAPAKPPSQESEEEKMPPYDAATQALIDAAQKAREEFEEAERSLKEMEESIRNLEQEISFDFGPHGEFSYLYSQCYELSTSEYIYRLCPFKRVSQKPKHGGSETNLGTWGSWAGTEDDRFSVMKYEHGTGCWQGPARSTMVKLLCGKETVVTAATEPSRCEYMLHLETPAACQEPHEVPPGDHDEL